jgi:hypothetical protein
MTGKLIAHKIGRRRAVRLIQQADGNAIFWLYSIGRQQKQTVFQVSKEKIEELIKEHGLDKLVS